MASVVLNKDIKGWFSELHVDLEKIQVRTKACNSHISYTIYFEFHQEICKYIMGLYELWRSFDEKKEMASILAKMPKPKVQPPPPQQQQQQQQQQNPQQQQQMQQQQQQQQQPQQQQPHN